MSADSRLGALSALRPALQGFADLRLVVWGDLVGDVFLYGSTTRVSREAPALVLCYESEELRPGAAGNAALNAAALGASVQFVGFVGDDAAGRALRDRLASRGVGADGVVERSDASTPLKTRVMAGGHHTARQQILRIDRDRPWQHDDGAAGTLKDRLLAAVDGADALLISDYGLGSVSASTFRELRRTAPEDLLTTLDSRHALLEYSGVSAATPNQGEVEAALGIRLDGEVEALEAAGRELLERLQSRNLIITRGSAGMAVFDGAGAPAHLPIHGTDQVADVTGAGDTVIAAFTCGLAAGVPTVDAARLANVAAGLVVMKRGTATVPLAELEEALEES